MSRSTEKPQLSIAPHRPTPLLGAFAAVCLLLAVLACSPNEPEAEEIAMADAADAEASVEVERAGVEFWTCDRYNAVSDTENAQYDEDVREEVELWAWTFFNTENEANMLDTESDNVTMDREMVAQRLAEVCSNEPGLLIAEATAALMPDDDLTKEDAVDAASGSESSDGAS